ncbi:SufE family protein [Candidatus Enterovibrio escicola]|nr:SufE family protein [Candidatus Enterovibrio escacola]
MNTLCSHPFGTEITADDILDKMSACYSWEDKYRLVIQMGKKLPIMDEALKPQSLQGLGCESQVWLVWKKVDDYYYFSADADSRIVKGLLALILASIEAKTHEKLKAFNFEEYFSTMDFINHISQSLSNDLRVIIKQIKNI